MIHPFSKLTPQELQQKSLEVLRTYASTLGITGASKLRGGKAALLDQIALVRGREAPEAEGLNQADVLQAVREVMQEVLGPVLQEVQDLHQEVQDLRHKLAEQKAPAAPEAAAPDPKVQQELQALRTTVGQLTRFGLSLLNTYAYGMGTKQDCLPPEVGHPNYWEFRKQESKDRSVRLYTLLQTALHALALQGKTIPKGVWPQDLFQNIPCADGTTRTPEQAVEAEAAWTKGRGY